MKRYAIVIDIDASLDIAEAADWYNERVENLGSSFKKHVKAQIKTLKTNADVYSIRYKEIRCVLVKRFPFLIHFAVNEQQQIVTILAVIHTSRSPEIWDQKTNDFKN